MSTDANDDGTPNEILEAWQWQADEFYQRCMRTPLALQTTSLMLNRLLDFSESYRRLNEFCFNSPEPLSLPMDEFSELRALYTRAILDAWRAYPGSTLLPSLAATPHEVVHHEGKLRVLHYKSTATARHAVPLLVVSSLVNRYYILDLTAERS